MEERGGGKREIRRKDVIPDVSVQVGIAVPRGGGEGAVKAIGQLLRGQGLRVGHAPHKEGVCAAGGVLEHKEGVLGRKGMFNPKWPKMALT